MQLIFTIAGIHLLACLSPGPDIFLVILNSMRHGWRAGVRTTAGILSGVSLHVILGITGISLLITKSAQASGIVALLGGLWLIYLGGTGIANALRGSAAKPSRQSAEGKDKGKSSLFLEGLLVNLLNVKALLFFLSLFSILLGPDVPLRLRILAGFVIIGVQGIAFTLVACMVDLKAFRSRWDRLQGGFEVAISLLLAALGCWIWIQTFLSTAP